MKQSTAVVELEVMRPVCLELYQDCKDLGRFMLRTGGNTIAAGVVTKVWWGHCLVLPRTVILHGTRLVRIVPSGTVPGIIPMCHICSAKFLSDSTNRQC